MTSRRLLSPIAKLLLEAADYIEANGHYQGALYENWSDPHSPVCVFGALRRVALLDTNRALNDQLNYQPLAVRQDNYELAKRALELQIVGGIDSNNHIIDWNDDPTRTPDDVIAALRAAAIATQDKGSA